MTEINKKPEVVLLEVSHRLELIEAQKEITPEIGSRVRKMRNTYESK